MHPFVTKSADAPAFTNDSPYGDDDGNTARSTLPYLFMLHGDGQPPRALDGLLAMTQTRPGSRIMAVTAKNSAVYRFAVKAKAEGHPVTLVQGVRSEIKGNVRSTFLIELGRLLSLPGGTEMHWVVISRSPEVRSTADRLEALGAMRVSVAAEPTPALFEELTQEEATGGLTDILLGLFSLAYRESRGQLHVGVWTARVIEAVPALRNPLERRRLFGSKRFNRIAKRIGLTVEHGGMMHQQGEQGTGIGMGETLT